MTRVKAETYAIIVAAGKGIRMRNATRKQYIHLDGIPMLARTLRIFGRCDRIDRIIMAVPADDMDFCRTKILPTTATDKEIILVAGGDRRQDSVYNGLQAVEASAGIVLIHDGVRPLVKTEHVVACIEGARKNGACILGIPAFDTIKQVNVKNEITATRKRDALWMAQTPQAFELTLIKKAHETAKRDGFRGTDDASLVERQGKVVKMIPGSRSNIKITSQEDLKLAQALLRIYASDL